ncbi:Copper transport protein ctr4 [Ceratocystis lukuohia]|uniref:Copper transport protein n=1 Tax=Ceratocystis lukuohia TaxID=2019550 RepID=A0ABR4MTN9_9PEZI
MFPGAPNLDARHVVESAAHVMKEACSACTASKQAEDMAMTMTMDSSNSTMAMDMGATCKINMLWNWYTIDACFLAESWHITSKGMFAGSCIGVVLMVVMLEFLRRSSKEFDRWLIAQHIAAYTGGAAAIGAVGAGARAASATSEGAGSDKAGMGCGASSTPAAAAAVAVASQPTVPPFRPNVWQQATRALLHVMQFALAYIIMLLAMYFNGYIIICIFIGAFIGAFIFHWETINVGSSGEATSAAKEPTVCCG